LRFPPVKIGVIRIRVHREFDVLVKSNERAVHPLGLFRGNNHISLSVYKEQRCVHAIVVIQGRIRDVPVRVLPQRATHSSLAFRPRGPVNRLSKVDVEQIRDAIHTHGSFEPVGLADERVDRVAAVALTNHTQFFRIYDACSDCCIQSRQHAIGNLFHRRADARHGNVRHQDRVAFRHQQFL
jgi:hypothetical protein